MPEHLNKIASACVVECVRQHVEVFELGNLLLAYNYALQNAEDGQAPWSAGVLRVAAMIEPTQNQYGFREVPVTFAGGGKAIPARQVRRAMERLLTAIDDFQEFDDADQVNELVHEFLKIHPYIDGNGRTAFVLHNWLSGTLLDPHPLPEYTFV